MRDYVILTDSCCDLPAEVVEELGVQVLPLSFRIEEKDYFDYPDNRDMDPHEFYEKLRGGAMGTTSAINPTTFAEAMTAIVESGRDVLYLAFSSGLSTTCQSACMAAREVMEAHPDSKVLVVDSLSAALGQGMLVYLTAKEKEKGLSLEELRDFAEEKKDHIGHWVVADDLNHLKRGGRVSATAAAFGTMLQVKPIIHIDDDGHLVPVGKARGRKAGLKLLVDKMAETVTDPSVVFITHADCPEEAEALGETIKAKFPVQRMLINYIGPVIGNHTGPGTIAIFFQATHK